MRDTILICSLSVVMVSAATFAFAHVDHDEEVDVVVVSDRERELAQVLGMPGPTETVGVAAVVKLGNLPLGLDFPELDGRKMRARELTLLPGGTVAVHQHESRPGVAYIIEGEAVEHRNDRPEPIVRRAGDVAFEQSGTIHWWENLSDAPARVLVVDIVPDDME